MMPTTYAKLIPITPVPNYKYANEDAGELAAEHMFYVILLSWGKSIR